MNAFRSKLATNVLANRNYVMKSMAFSTAITTATSTSTIAFCQGKKGEDEEDAISKIKAIISSNVDVEAIGKNLGEKVNEAIATGVPTEISYGFVCGFSSGFALKKVGKVASIMFGLGFATLQTLSYAGYIDVDHSQLQKDVEKMMDLNSDGKIDAKDGEKVMDKVMEVLQFGMVGGGGFAAGFIGGFRSG